MRDFSKISEKLGPAITLDWMGDVLDTLSKSTLREGGVVVGDEISTRRRAGVKARAAPMRCIRELHRGQQRISMEKASRAQAAPTRKYVVSVPLPFTLTSPRGSKRNRPARRAWTSAVTWMRPGCPVDSMRLATFTVSPHMS